MFLGLKTPMECGGEQIHTQPDQESKSSMLDIKMNQTWVATGSNDQISSSFDIGRLFMSVPWEGGLSQARANEEACGAAQRQRLNQI